MIKNSQETNNIEEFLYLEKEHFINKKTKLSASIVHNYEKLCNYEKVSLRLEQDESVSSYTAVQHHTGCSN